MIYSFAPPLSLSVPSCVAAMLRECQTEVLTRADTLRYLGERFRFKFFLPPWVTDEEICYELLRYGTMATLIT